MKKKLMALLTVWVILVVGGGIGYMMHLGKQISGRGPQALAADGQGGFFLVAGDDLLHFNADEKAVSRQLLGKLGLKSANSLHYRNGELLAYDNERHRIFRCNTGSWTCSAFSPESLPFSDFVSMAWLPSGELLVSDNTHHRLVTLNADGKPVFIGESVWHYPNQVTAADDGLLLADTNHFSILHLANAGATQSRTLLQTRSRPYQFVQRDAAWWVLQAGLKLESGRLYRYRDGQPEKISTSAEDPVALLDNGNRLIIASRQDWRLLSLDPETGNAVPVSDNAFQAELTAKRLNTQAVKKQRGRIPYAMLALLLPALLGGVMLQKRLDADAEGNTEAMPSKPLQAAVSSMPPRENFRIDTDRSGIEMQRLQQNRMLIKAGLIAIPLLLLMGLVVGLSGARIPQLMPLLLLCFFLVAMMPLMVYLGRRRQDRLFDQHFICGPQKLVHVKQGKPVSATPYADIWLGSDTLLLRGKPFPLYMGAGKLRTAFWMVHDVQREIGKRIPANQFFHSDYELGKAMLSRSSLLGLRLILARNALAAAIVDVLLLKLLHVLHQLHVDKLWKIFHPS